MQQETARERQGVILGCYCPAPFQKQTVPWTSCLCSHYFQQLGPHRLQPDKPGKAREKGDLEPEAMEKRTDQKLRKVMTGGLPPSPACHTRAPSAPHTGVGTEVTDPTDTSNVRGLESIATPHSPKASLPNPPQSFPLLLQESREKESTNTALRRQLV